VGADDKEEYMRQLLVFLAMVILLGPAAVWGSVQENETEEEARYNLTITYETIDPEESTSLSVICHIDPVTDDMWFEHTALSPFTPSRGAASSNRFGRASCRTVAAPTTACERWKFMAYGEAPGLASVCCGLYEKYLEDGQNVQVEENVRKCLPDPDSSQDSRP
jgi:hypothetical protein